MPVGPLFCVINGPTRGWPAAGPARAMLRRLGARASVRRRFAPHQLRHAHAIGSPTKACRSTSSSASSHIMRVIVSSARSSKARNDRSRGLSVEPGEESVEDLLSADLSLLGGVVALALERGAEFECRLEVGARFADRFEVA